MDVFPVVYADSFIELPIAGRTAPKGFLCSGQDTDVQDSYIVKLKGRKEVIATTFLYEAFGVLLARQIGIKTPDPAVVILPIDLTINTSDPIIKNSIGYNFGSKYIQGASSMVLNNRARSYKEAACKILVFDALIENVDRRENNPNLLNHDRTLYAIDHELAFSFIRAIGPRDYTFLREHALRDLAKGAESLIDAICEDLSDLYTWDSLNILADRIPEEWKKDQEPVVDEIIKHIDDVCKNSAQLSNYIKEVLR